MTDTKTPTTNVGFHNSDAMLAKIADHVKSIGSQKAAAQKLGITAAHLCDVLQKRRGISTELADRFGYKKLEIFIRKQDA